VDLDSYVVRHGPEWDRLADLAARPSYGRAKLSGSEIDELVELYQRAGTQLSVVRSSHADPVLEARLSSLVAQARSVVTGATTPAWRYVGRFFVETFPAAVYRARWTVLGVAAGCLLVAFVVGWRVVNVPGLAASLGSDAQIQQLVQHDFEAYYSENPAGDFALLIWLNNAKVTAACLVSGIVVLPTVNMLYANMEGVGEIGGLMWTYGRAEVFFGLLLTHGLLELTCVFVGAGAGLRLAWAWIAPGYAYLFSFGLMGMGELGGAYFPNYVVAFSSAAARLKA